MTVPVEIARELRYELGMIEFTHAELSDVAWNAEKALSTGTIAALVESFIAHARLMDEFLGGRPTVRKDDVRAAQFVSSWARGGFLAQEYRDLADKQLLHFTTWRRRRERWPIHAVARELAGTYLEFYDLLEPDDQYELEGTAISARAVIERCNNDPRHEMNLGLVWKEAEEEGLQR